jgi:hypothetical protein
MHYMDRIMHQRDALDRVAFHAALRRWLVTSTAETIADLSKLARKGTPWVLVFHEGRYYELNADTTRLGVQGYLHSVEKYGEDIAWSIRTTNKGNETKVVFGPFQLAEPGFFLFARTR